MKIGFVVYSGMTTLDFVGIYDPLTRLKTMGFLENLKWDICGIEEKVIDDRGLALLPTLVGAPLEGYNLVVVPGGIATRKLIHDASFIDWLKTSRTCPLKVSVCSGALLLGASGFLKGKKAATHAAARDELMTYCPEVLDQRIVDEGDVITCGGVTAGIDLGLYLCGKFVSLDAKEIIKHQMDYHGSW
jgi:transcriptional regulator GlxA family with amidase domain